MDASPPGSDPGAAEEPVAGAAPAAADTDAAPKADPDAAVDAGAVEAPASAGAPPSAAESTGTATDAVAPRPASGGLSNVVAGVREFFLLEKAQARALRLTGDRGDRARALHEAGVARRRCADELVGAPVVASAFVLYRDALRLLARARFLDADLSAAEDPAAALAAVGSAVDALGEPDRTRFRRAFAVLVDDDPLALENVPEAEVPTLREATEDFFRWLEGTVDPRTVGKLRVMRVLRIAGGVMAVLVLLRAGFHKIFAPPNVALAKPVIASSRFPGTPDPQGLTDGNAFALGVHTAVESSPWITVDLGQRYKVGNIRIHNRTDCCMDEGLGLIVEVGDPGDPAPFVAQRNEHYDVWELDAGGKEAQTVKLRLARNGYIALSELEVFVEK